MTLSTLGDAQYIALETFRKNGTGVITPVWVAGENGSLFVWTDADSWKVKRIRNNSRVRLVASDARGNPEGEWIVAAAAVVEAADEIKKTEKRLASKYGFMFHVFSFMGRLRRAKRTAIEITAV